MTRWPRVRLAECCEIVSGATPTTSIAAYWDGDIAWVTPKDLSDLDGLYISDTPRKITRAGLDSCAATMLPARSVLFTSRAPIGHVAVNTVPMATNQGFKSLVPRPGQLDTMFLYWWLRSNRAYLEGLGNGATFKEVSKAVVSRVEIPMPPLPEQRRIAVVLDRAETLRAKRRAALAQLDGLAQAIFLDMFGNPTTNPKGWFVGPVSNYVAEFQGGRSFAPESGENVVTRNRVLKVSAVTGMKYVPNESKPVPDGYEPPPEHFVRPGDLLFSRANTTELVGAVAYIDATPANLLLPDKLWRFVWRQPALADSLFVCALFQTQPVRHEIGRRATGTSGSMKNISQEKVLGIQTIIPPLTLQLEFGHRVRAIEKLKTAQTASLTGLDALFASLQHRAFSGEL